MQKKHVVKDILKQHNITSWYQPIVNVESRELLGWEAFSRGLETEQGLAAPAMFVTAAEAGILKPFDLMCIHNAASCFEQLQLGPKLFINLSNEMLIAISRVKKQVGKMIADNAIPPTSIVLEIDEMNASQNTENLVDAAKFFHELGFEIAIDHLSGIESIGKNKELHSLWEELSPDYIKLDRAYIQGINGSASKQKLVKEVVAVARALGTILIAEGVETYKELKKLYELGIHHVQGYLIQKPELSPLPPNLNHLLEHKLFSETNQSSLASDLVVSKSSVHLKALVNEVFAMFENNVYLNSIAVLDDHSVEGIIYRRPFLLKYAQKQRREVVQQKKVSNVMTKHFLKVDAQQRIEQVSRLVTARAQISEEHDFVIVSEDRFLGIGTVIDLLRKVTQLRVRPDHQENLLTMLPGNTPIGACVNELLEKGAHFSIALLDLSNFKVFNNHYSHIVGDQVLIMFADILRRHLKLGANFAGHIGGDDFVLVMPSDNCLSLLRSIFSEFKHKISRFYSDKDIERGGIQKTDIKGNKELIGFISLSAGVMSIENEYYDSFHNLLTNLIKLKPLTKNDQGVCIAHEFQGSIEQYCFEENEFELYVDESQNAQSES
jgi:diguanylate cyclase (GGDEF)-like protein